MKYLHCLLLFPLHLIISSLAEANTLLTTVVPKVARLMQIQVKILFVISLTVMVGGIRWASFNLVFKKPLISWDFHI